MELKTALKEGTFCIRPKIPHLDKLAHVKNLAYMGAVCHNYF